MGVGGSKGSKVGGDTCGPEVEGVLNVFQVLGFQYGQQGECSYLKGGQVRDGQEGN